jgi:DNA-binding protein WhiA
MNDQPVASFKMANDRRSREAAGRTAEQASRALRVLGDDALPSWRAAAQLRIAHPGMSLTELAQAAQPPMTKDAFAARLRRLIVRAEQRNTTS